MVRREVSADTPSPSLRIPVENIPSYAKGNEKMETEMGIALGLSIVLLAGTTQGLTSFGFALISVPFLSTILPIPEVVPIVVILSIGTNLIIMAGSYRDIEFHRIWILITASLIAAPFGTLALICVPPNLIKISVGILLVLVSSLMLIGRSFPLKSQRLAYVPIGLLSGFLNGSISMSGPPVALFMTNQDTKKEIFRANITMYAIILNVFTLVTFLFGGLLSRHVLVDSLWLIPSMVLGVAIGTMAVSKVSQPLFRSIALCLVLASGVWTLLGAIKTV